MIILRNKNKNSGPFERKLEAQGILDYEVSPEISEDSISVTKDLEDFKIYLPEEYELHQYELMDFLRMNQIGLRAFSNQEYDTCVISCSKTITESTFIKVLKKVIDLEGFVTIVDEDMDEI